MTDDLVRSVIVCFCLDFLVVCESDDQLSASVWFVLLVVANGTSSSSGVHCIGVQSFRLWYNLLMYAFIFCKPAVYKTT